MTEQSTDTRTPAPDATPPRTPRRGARAKAIVWSAVAAVAVAAIVAVMVIAFVPQGSASHDVEPNINPTMAALLQLDNVSSQHAAEPSFQLTDQHGNPMSANEFRGRAVVFAVNDDQCEDLCTLLAEDIIAADRDLGPAAQHVAFVSINANPYYPSVQDIAAWSHLHHLDTLSNWYYGTGTPAQLQSDWAKFGVPVELNATTRTVDHGSQIFFISPNGTEEALGAFGTESADTAPFAHAMAQMAVDLLPASQRGPVGGPVITTSTGGGALNSIPAPIRVPSLTDAGQSLSTASTRGQYAVLNFWSSTCAACVQELPNLQEAHLELGSRVAFLGDDVSDVARDGQAFAAKAGVTYPLLNDQSGKISGQYRISGLPYTVVLDPHGRVLVRHAGVFTPQQLTYVVRTLQADGGNDASGVSAGIG